MNTAEIGRGDGMNETKFTTGPWKIVEDRVPSSLEVYGGTTAICECWRRANPETEIANARLIAAAPELYDFVEEYLEAWENGMAGDSYLFHLAQAVRGKARGEA